MIRPIMMVLASFPFSDLIITRSCSVVLKSSKDLIDDYDLHSCSLSNNLVDFDTPIHVVKGFEGDNLDELQQNIKTKKIIGMESTDAGAGVDVKTVNIPYEAKKDKA